MTKQLAIAVVALSAFSASAAEFTTAARPGQSVMRISDQSIPNGISFSDGLYCSVGHQNTLYNMNTFLWAGLPDRFCTDAKIVCPVALRGAMTNANLDVWWLGFQDVPSCPTAAADKASLHVFEDSPGLREKPDHTYYMLNGRMPVKLLDNAIATGTYVDWGEGQFKGVREFEPDGLMTQIGMAYNRGAQTNGCMLLRFNPDALECGGEFRFSGYKTETAATNPATAAMHVVFSAEDEVAPVAPHLTEGERTGADYVKSTVSWMQYRESDGTRGFEYPAWCGVRNGRRRDLIFVFDAPAYTLTNAWLTLTALPPFAGSVPDDANVSLSFLGFVDAPAANADLEVTDAMLEGQEPLVLQASLPIRSLVAGQNLFTNARGQRDLIRTLNRRAKDAAFAGVGRTDKKAVLRLSVTSDTAADWRFSLGSVATPRVESFFECVEYRKEIAIFSNGDFENGLEGWTISPTSHTESQIAVVTDPTDPGNHCLRLCNCDNLSGGIDMYCSNSDKETINRYRGYPARVTYRIYVDPEHPFVNRGTNRTEFSYFIWLYHDSEKKTTAQPAYGRMADNETQTGSWRTAGSGSKLFPSVEQDYERLYIQHRFDATIDANSGTTWYVDDVQLYVEDFYEYPKERFGLVVSIR